MANARQAPHTSQIVVEHGGSRFALNPIEALALVEALKEALPPAVACLRKEAARALSVAELAEERLRAASGG